MQGQSTGTWKQTGNANTGTVTGHENETGKKRLSEAEEMVLVLVLLPAQGPNQERPGPQPCAVATKARTVLIA
ncbi:uncharacterized protein ARMOST_05601 [Armillaria ostoyae]|uniref:Uncharacterized protein n=1 Tax=Armillaria ostoyae TaxID=47428 RepID=A0A284R0S3_ARMOS|nr:uncharacterized protein ARMOST_05601 [Armillaria ostoyae]